MTTTAAGQNASATFTGTANQRIQFQTSGSTFAQGVYWSILRPNGTALVNSSNNSLIDTITLPDTGTYKLLVDPVGTSTGSVAAKVWSVPADADAGTLSIDGATKTVTTTAAGQNASATFTGTANQRIQFQTTLPDTGTYKFTVDPVGTGTGAITAKVSTAP